MYIRFQTDDHLEGDYLCRIYLHIYLHTHNAMLEFIELLIILYYSDFTVMIVRNTKASISKFSLGK